MAPCRSAMRASQRACSRSSARFLGVARPPESGGEVGHRLARAPGERRQAMPICASSSAAHLDRPIEQEPHVAFGQARGAQRRADRSLRRARKGRSPGYCRGPAARPKPISTDYRSLFPERLYVELFAAHDPIEEAAEDGADRARLCAQPAARGDQPRRLCRTHLPRRPRRDAVHRPFGLLANARAVSFVGRSLAEGRRRTCASSSPTCPRRSPTLGHRPALRDSRAAAAGRSSPRLGDDRRMSSFGDARGSRERGSGRGPGGPSASPISTGSIISSGSSPRGFSRLFPDRRRFHQMGQGARHPGGPGRGSGAGSVVAWS